jgi:hypothetical protein
MRCLVVDDDPRVGQSIRVWRKHRGLRMSAADGGPVCPSPPDVVGASTDHRGDIQQRVKPLRTVTNLSSEPGRSGFAGDGARSSGGAASVNHGRLPDVAGRRYTPRLE